MKIPTYVKILGALAVLGAILYNSTKNIPSAPTDPLLPPDTSSEDQGQDTTTPSETNNEAKMDFNFTCASNKNCQRGFFEYDSLSNHPYDAQSIKANAKALKKSFSEFWEAYIDRATGPLVTIDITMAKHKEMVTVYQSLVTSEIVKIYNDPARRAQVQQKATNKLILWLEVAIVEAIKIINKPLRIKVGLPASSPAFGSLSGFRFGFLGI